MPACELVLRLDPRDAEPNWLHDPAAPALRKSFYRSLGLRGSDTWVTIDPAAPKSAETLDRIEVFVKSGAVALGEVRLRESPTAAELEACEWFALENRFFKGDPGYSVWDDYPSCRSAAIPDGIHLFADVVCSAAFRAVVEAQQQRGLEFLRVKEKSRKPKLAWHVAVARAPLGQGVDHPWFDRRRWERYLREHAALTLRPGPDPTAGAFSRWLGARRRVPFRPAARPVAPAAAGEVGATARRPDRAAGGALLAGAPASRRLRLRAALPGQSEPRGQAFPLPRALREPPRAQCARRRRSDPGARRRAAARRRCAAGGRARPRPPPRSGTADVHRCRAGGTARGRAGDHRPLSLR